MFVCNDNYMCARICPALCRFFFLLYRLYPETISCTVQSDSASRKRSFDWTFFGQDSSDPSSFVPFLEAVGVRKYCSTAVWQSKIGWQLCASRVLRKQRVLSARRTLVPASWWLWAYCRKLRSWSCNQPRAAKATAGVTVVGKIGSIPRAAAVV